MNNIKLSFISLGCPKNNVDSEKIINNFNDPFFSFEPDPSRADAVLINTCGFIKPAMDETFDTIQEMLSVKISNTKLKVIAFGCAISRDFEYWQRTFPEIDAFFRLNEEQKLINFVHAIFKYPQAKKKIDVLKNVRNISATLPHYAYLKIAEGCSRFCSFCTIPSIRGRYISIPREKIIKEADLLVKRGVKELILIAQDTTMYGMDLYKKPSLLALLKDLVTIKGLEWIRILYAYPEHIDDKLLHFIVDSKKITNYLDLPIQHSHPEMLKKMKREGTSVVFDKIFKKLREFQPDFGIRTSVITGFPGETEEHHQHLLNYLSTIKFNRLGVFQYYQEKGTSACELKGQVPDNIKENRYKELMFKQQEIHFQANKHLKGKSINTIIDSHIGKNIYLGRTYLDVPEIDALIQVKSRTQLKLGSIVQVKVNGFIDYDLKGRVV